MRSVLSLDGRHRLSMVAISCRRAYHVCSTAVATTTGAAATGRGHRLLLPLLTTHCYAVALHAVRRYSRASDGGRHDNSITVAADDERVTVPPPPITRDALPVWNGTTTSTDRGISTVRTLLYRVLRITPKSLHTIHPPNLCTPFTRNHQSLCELCFAMIPITHQCLPVLSVMATHEKHRKHHKVRDSDNVIPPNTTMTSLITTRDLINQPPNPYFGNNHGYDPNPLTPLRNLVNRLQAFLAVMDTSPPRLQYSPGIRQTTYQDVTAQTSIHLGSSSGQPLHHQSAADIEQQRNMFNTNVDNHYLLFPQVNTSSSSQVHTQPIVSGVKADQDDDVDNQCEHIATPMLQTRYMGVDTMELIPQARDLPMYEDNSPAARKLRHKCTIAKLEHMRNAMRGYDSTQGGNIPKTDFTKRKKVVHARNSSPPTAPAIVYMVSRSTQVPGHSVSSQSPSTTPGSVRSRQSNTFDLRDIRTAPATTPRPESNVPQDSDAAPGPTNDENRG